MRKGLFVSIIVVNFNGDTCLEECLVSLLGQSYKEFEVIVVDNASKDKSLEFARKYLAKKNVRLICSKENIGCPAGRNLGLAHARGRIIAFLDNDAFVEKQWLEKILPLFQNASVGVVGTKLLFPDGRVQSLGGKINLQGYGFDMVRGREKVGKNLFFATGCGLVTSREVLTKVGLFDPVLFNYYDDVDFCLRVHNAGYRVVLQPEAVAYHRFSVSDKYNKNKKYLCERNRIRTVLKYAHYSFLLRWIAAEIAYEAFLCVKNPSYILFWGKIWYWNISFLWSVFSYRRRVSRVLFRDLQPFMRQSWGPVRG